MRNIFVLPTDKPSRLAKHSSCSFHIVENNAHKKGLYNMTNQYIYITNDEAIKEGDWYFNHRIKKILKCNSSNINAVNLFGVKKVILTTDPNLIKDGVQELDDEFLEWFIKNPSCEWVDVKSESSRKFGMWKPECYPQIYKIIIPKEEPKPLPDVNWQSEIINKVWDEEEPKQETLEELAKNTTKKYVNEREKQTAYLEFISGYQLAQEHAKKMFSEESMFDFARFCSDNHSLDDSDKDNICWTPIFKESVKLTTKEMFEKFKNKK